LKLKYFLLLFLLIFISFNVNFSKILSTVRYTIEDVVGCWELWHSQTDIRTGSAGTTTRYYLEKNGRFKVYMASWVSVPGTETRLTEKSFTGNFTVKGNLLEAKPDLGPPFKFNFTISGGAIIVGNEKYIRCR
jgi:hypothetical protein